MIFLPNKRSINKLIRIEECKILANYYSGNPWIITVSDNNEDDVVILQNQRYKIAIMGKNIKRNKELFENIGLKTEQQILDYIKSAPDLYSYVYINAKDALCAMGSTSGCSAIFYMLKNDLYFFSESQIELKNLFHIPLDVSELVIRMSDAESYFPYSSGLIWRDIKQIPPCYRMKIKNGNQYMDEWFKFDNPNFELKDLADDFRIQLLDVVSCYTNGNSALSLDLSGGLDSTTIVYAAKQVANDLRTIFLDPDDQSNSDKYWAQATSKIINSNHIDKNYNDIAKRDDEDESSRK